MNGVAAADKGDSDRMIRFSYHDARKVATVPDRVPRGSGRGSAFRNQRIYFRYFSRLFRNGTASRHRDHPDFADFPRKIQAPPHGFSKNRPTANPSRSPFSGCVRTREKPPRTRAGADGRAAFPARPHPPARSRASAMADRERNRRNISLIRSNSNAYLPESRFPRRRIGAESDADRFEAGWIEAGRDEADSAAKEIRSRAGAHRIRSMDRFESPRGKLHRTLGRNRC